MVTTSRIWTSSGGTWGKLSSSTTVLRPSGISWRTGFPSSPGSWTGQTTSWWSSCHSSSPWWRKVGTWGQRSGSSSSCTTTFHLTNVSSLTSLTVIPFHCSFSSRQHFKISMQNKTFKAISAILQAQDVYEWDENICYECVNGLHVFLMQCCWYSEMYIIVEKCQLIHGEPLSARR